MIAIIAILAGMLLPTLSKAKKKGGQAKCVSNLKQLTLGVLMYIDENQDNFPGTASRNTYGFHKEDWIYWRTNTTRYPSIVKSPIVSSLGSVSSNLFRCPEDRYDKERLAIADGNGPYFYSYSLTSYDLEGAVISGWLPSSKVRSTLLKRTCSRWPMSEGLPPRSCSPRSSPRIASTRARTHEAPLVSLTTADGFQTGTFSPPVTARKVMWLSRMATSCR